MDKAIIYIHGKGGSSKDTSHYITIFKDCDVIGFDYMSNNPWEAFLYFTNKIESYIMTLQQKSNTHSIKAGSYPE